MADFQRRMEMRKSWVQFFYETKGQAGAGALIIFMAMILVAAVASGVLIKTSGKVQTKATVTGEQAVVEVSSYLRIVNIVGYSSDNINISSVIMAAQLGTGSGDVDIDDIVLSFQTEDLYTSGISASTSTSGGVVNFTFDFIKNTTANDILERGETVEITYTDLDNDLDIAPNQVFRITLQPRSGQLTYVEKRVPNIISQSYVSRWS